jgi:hypothetical protein
MIANGSRTTKTRSVGLKIEITQDMATRIWNEIMEEDPIAEGIPITMSEASVAFHPHRTSFAQAIKEGKLYTVSGKKAREIIQRSKEIRCMISEPAQDSRFCLWVLTCKDNLIAFEVQPHLYEKFIKASLNRHRLLSFYTEPKGEVDPIH